MDDLTNYITSNSYKEVVKYFSHDFGIRFSLIVYVYESHLLIYEDFKVNSNIHYTKTSNRAKPNTYIFFIMYKIRYIYKY